MTVASAYTLDDLLEILDRAHGALIDKREAEYEKNLSAAKEELENLLAKYPEDEELKEYSAEYTSFLERKEEGLKREIEKKKLSALVSDLRQLIHWRKLGMSSGKDLPFKDYRSLRGEVGRRGL
jgi:predicted RNase H-like nuclease (RuvC/YqgF family)